MAMNRRMFLSLASKTILATTTAATLPVGYILERQKLNQVWVNPKSGKPWPFGDGSQERPFSSIKDAIGTVAQYGRINISEGAHKVESISITSVTISGNQSESGVFIIGKENTYRGMQDEQPNTAI